MRANFWSAHAAALADAYARSAGTIRFELVTRALAKHMSSFPQRIVDVGGGFGLQAIMLARAGHSVVVVDFDPQMLAMAETRLLRETEEVASRIELVLGDGNEAAGLVGTGFDVACCHSVLMYEQDFMPMLLELAKLVRKEGLVSLLSINKECYAMRSGLQGRWREAVAILEGRETDSQSVPNHKHSLDEIIVALRECGMKLKDWYGVGVFTDHVTERIDREHIDDLIQLEWIAGSRDPYRQVARCFHALAERL